MQLKFPKVLGAVVLSALIPLTAKAQQPQQKDSTAAATQPAAAAPAADLDSYMGFYQGSAPGRGIMITVEDGVLYGEPTGSDKTQLILKAGTTYFVGRKDSPGTVTFKLGADGKPEALVLKAPNGQERTFPKFKG
ncbi:MAG TPA: DUF3471 domain-containing protein [Gemmatimonadaceae bacterium]